MVVPVPLATPGMLLLGLLMVAGPFLASSWPPTPSLIGGPPIATIGDQEDPDVMTTILDQVTSKKHFVANV